jgi:F-type H+-transporting ATPase subunit b
MYLAEANIITINATLLIEVVAFLLMLWLLGKYVYPRIDAMATARQKAISEALESAEKQRQEAQQQLEQAQAKLEDARKQAQEVIAGAKRSAEQVREELKAKGEEEAKRMLESARRDIEAARQQAVESLRGEVADMVIEATRKVVGEALDPAAHRKLIDQAIEEVGAGGRSR